MVRDELGDSTWSGRCSGVYGDREKQDWYFTSKAVVAMANIWVDGSERLLSWVGVSVCVSGPMRRSVSN